MRFSLFSPPVPEPYQSLRKIFVKSKELLGDSKFERTLKLAFNPVHKHEVAPFLSTVSNGRAYACDLSKVAEDSQERKVWREGGFRLLYIMLEMEQISSENFKVDVPDPMYGDPSELWTTYRTLSFSPLRLARYQCEPLRPASYLLDPLRVVSWDVFFPGEQTSRLVSSSPMDWKTFEVEHQDFVDKKDAKMVQKMFSAIITPRTSSLFESRLSLMEDGHKDLPKLECLAEIISRLWNDLQSLASQQSQQPESSGSQTGKPSSQQPGTSPPFRQRWQELGQRKATGLLGRGERWRRYKTLSLRAHQSSIAAMNSDGI